METFTLHAGPELPEDASHEGFGFPMTASELERVNTFRHGRGRPPLDCSPGVRFLNYGKGKEGYWDYEMFAKQVRFVSPLLFPSLPSCPPPPPSPLPLPLW